MGDHQPNGAGAAPAILLIARDTIQFNVASDYWLDVRAFSEAIQISIGHSHPDLFKCAFCAQRLREAADLYRGEMLAGFSVDRL